MTQPDPPAEERIPVGVPHDFVSEGGSMFCDADLSAFGYGRCGFIRSAGWHTNVAAVHPSLAELERLGPAFEHLPDVPSVTVEPDGRISGYISPPLAPMFERDRGEPERDGYETMGGGGPLMPKHPFKGSGMVHCQAEFDGVQCNWWLDHDVHDVGPKPPTRPSPTVLDCCGRSVNEPHPFMCRPQWLAAVSCLLVLAALVGILVLAASS